MKKSPPEHFNNLRKNLKGFESILDSVSSDSEYKKRRMREIKGKDKAAPIKDFEYFNFLENELERLTVLDNFFSNKVHNLVENSNLKFLLQEQIDKKDIAKFELIEKLQEEGSTFRRHLAHIFDSTFY